MLWYAQPAEAEGHLLGYTLSVQCAQAIAYAVAMQQCAGAFGEVGMLGAMSYDDIGLGTLCLAAAVSDIGFDEVAACGVLVWENQVTGLEGDVEMALLIAVYGV